jgi:hypothetical protein
MYIRLVLEEFVNEWIFYAGRIVKHIINMDFDLFFFSSSKKQIKLWLIEIKD